MKENLANPSMKMHSLGKLIAAHKEFQLELDIITTINNDPGIIDALIEIRNFNINCISRYSSMLVKSNIDLKTPSSNPQYFLTKLEENESLWQIRQHLLTLIGVYTDILVNGEINEFNRMIIAQNYDKMILIKEDLLHPILSV